MSGIPTAGTTGEGAGETAPLLREGERIGEFRIVGEISSGSQSRVFEAEMEDQRRHVALKVLEAGLTEEPRAVSRFCAEAAFAERVSHPSILPVLGSGRDRGHYFYAMRLESGSTLEDCAADAALHTDEEHYANIAVCFASVVRAVQTIHEHGIVHRDLKPSNILVDSEGRFVLTDFGSALDAQNRDRLLEQCVGGSVRYTSPEQLRPGADPYDPAGDLYALGMTLYEVCAGTSPFPDVGDDEMARLKMTRIPPSPRRLNRHVPMAIDAVIRQSIDTRVELRYATAEQMADDLERLGCRKRGSGRRH